MRTAKEEMILREKVSLYAYAYEIEHVSLVPDREYDALAAKVDATAETGDKAVDDYFKEHYSKDTAIWIYHHPQLEKIKARFLKTEV